MIVLGIDPGTANTGLAMVSEKDGVICAVTLKTKPSDGSNDFQMLAMRGRDMREQVSSTIDKLILEGMALIDVAVVEAYKDYGGGHLRGARRRYYTPNTIAYIDQALESAGIPIIYQDPSDVKRFEKYFSATIAQAKCLRNAHVRDAALHALYYLHTRSGGGNG